MTAQTTAFSQRLTAETIEVLQDAVRAAATAEGLDAVLTDDPDDVAYLTGFFHHPTERPVAVWLPVDGPAVLLVPRLEAGYARAQGAVAQVVEYAEYPGVTNPFAPLAALAAGRRVGHPLTSSFLRLRMMREGMDVAPVPTDVVMACRYVKRPAEIALHREAARISDLMVEAGVAAVRDALRADDPLPTEAELAALVGRVGTGVMYEEHRDVVVVGFMAGGLVYGGANSSYPHGLPSGYRLQEGDTFMLSLGCAVGGRFVECERTFVIGQPTEEQARYHEAVRRAQEVGASAIAPGVPCRDANTACLAELMDAGLGEYVLHRQGHGIGLGMHEPPWLEDGDPTPLAEGMVVSNEPGIYVPGHAGYRISDSMLVTETGAEALTSYPRSLADCTITA
ncbi:aminopeptidase P family protein [Georgenia sp. 311]|uniref:Aminopeptidase P family protein n=1 Tax=Georgenia wutianyii TaxID=2585135 RepID=A0ABX5VS73_9MICO|nr:MULTISPECIES: Xaa-Pro peptidase family protein [Georgenia]QDB79525.1 aminopeptidase P family protein [Georgenia wutianyii]TNC20527.1 aminopeptidase P family protein [Georgenia sp. 311]